MKVGRISGPGKGKTNEDCSLAVEFAFNKGEELLIFNLYIVADGMGGHQAGDLASQLAVSTITTVILETLLRLDQEKQVVSIEKVLRSAIQQANSAIYQKAVKSPALKGMGTTITMAFMVNNYVYIGHVGHSRAYIYHSNEHRLEVLTKDHTVAGKLLSANKITPQEAASHPKANVLTRALGVAEDVEVDTIKVMFEPEDMFLLCTDGLTKLMTDDELAKILKATKEYQTHPQKTCYAFDSLTRRLNRQDDVTVVVCEVDKISSAQVSTSTHQDLLAALDDVS